MIFIVFFVQSCKDRSIIQERVEAHGGLLVPELESGVFQLCPKRCLLKPGQTYSGWLLYETYVHDCIAYRKLLDHTNYLMPSGNSGIIASPMCNAKTFTILELAIIYKHMKSKEYANRESEIDFWEDAMQSGQLRGRKVAFIVNSIVHLWRSRISDLENLVQQAVLERTLRFCHNFHRVPDSERAKRQIKAMLSGVPVAVRENFDYWGYPDKGDLPACP